MTSTFRALSLVGKAELDQVRFALRLRGPIDGVCECKVGVKVYMDSYVASNGLCFMVTSTLFKNHRLGGRPNTKPGDHGHSKHSQPLVYSIFNHA